MARYRKEKIARSHRLCVEAIDSTRVELSRVESSRTYNYVVQSTLDKDNIIKITLLLEKLLRCMHAR
jgi:hypothetical protein